MAGLSVEFSWDGEPDPDDVAGDAIVSIGATDLSVQDIATLLLLVVDNLMVQTVTDAVLAEGVPMTGDVLEAVTEAHGRLALIHQVSHLEHRHFDMDFITLE